MIAISIALFLVKAEDVEDVLQASSKAVSSD